MSNGRLYFDPHGYFFVRLLAEASRRRLQQFNEGFDEGLIPVRGPFPPANRKRASSDQRLFSGTLRCHLYCITPVHIGSGSYRYDESAQGKVIADIVRDSEDHPVIPGSSLKGSFRAIAEAVSKSCVLFADVGKEKKEKLPGLAGFRRTNALFSPAPNSYWKTEVEPYLVPADRDIQVKIEIPKDLNHEECRADKGLCPCCAIFGKLGKYSKFSYRGRVAFTGARQIGKIAPAGGFQPPQVVTIPARHSPQPHRLAHKATWADGGLDGEPAENRNRRGEVQVKKLKIPQPLGRKFYPNWDPHGHFNTARYNWSQLGAGMPNQQALNRTFFKKCIGGTVLGIDPRRYMTSARSLMVSRTRLSLPAASWNSRCTLNRCCRGSWGFCSSAWGLESPGCLKSAAVKRTGWAACWLSLAQWRFWMMSPGQPNPLLLRKQRKSSLSFCFIALATVTASATCGGALPLT